MHSDSNVRFRYHRPMCAAAVDRDRIAERARVCAVLLAATVAAGCGERNLEPVRVGFRLNASLAAGCSGIPEPGQLRFYVSNLRMIDRHGSATPVRLDDLPTQSEAAGTALVSWSGDCGVRAGPTVVPGVSGTVAGGSYEALEFDLGVPFEHNHPNPLAAPPPLNVPSMFWTWQTGYKFLRLDIGSDWSFHLGSTGCVSPSAVRPPERCTRPNVATIRLPAAAARKGSVAVDLEALLGGIDTDTAANCVGDYDEAERCRALLARLGLDADTGRCDGGCAGQALFRYEGGDA